MQQAKLLVTQNSDFQSKIKGYGNTFDSIFVEGIFSPSCTVVWNDVNVVYDLTDSKGQYVKHVVVREDPLLNTVLGVSEQVGARFANLYPPSSIWSGYQFWYYPPNNDTRYPVWETNSSWQVPHIYQPTSSLYNPACNFSNGKPFCDIAVWNGLQDEIYGGSASNLVQGGTDSNMSCTSNCTTKNSMWYEFYVNSDSSGTFCNMTVNAGDNITSDITDITQNKTATSSQYDITIQDTTSDPGKVCGPQSSQNYIMSDPTYADYILERNTHNNAPQTLVNFTNVTMSGMMYYNNSYNSIQASVNAKYFGQITMEN